MRRGLPDFPLLGVVAATLALGPLCCGRSLGLVFFNVIVPAVLVLPLAGRGAVMPAVATAAASGLLAGAIVAVAVRAGLGAQTAALATALALAVVGTAEILGRLARMADLGRAAGGGLLIAWLTWPIWMAPHWTNPAVARLLDPLVAVHPLLAINGAGLDLGPWSHAPIAYRYLLNLGQDVPYAMPSSAWPAVAVHALTAAVLLGIARARRGHASGPE